MNARILSIGLVLGTALAFIACDKTEEIQDSQDLLVQDHQPSLKGGLGGPEFEPNVLVIKFKEGTDEGTKGRALGRLGGRERERIHNESMRRRGDDQGLMVVTVNDATFDAIIKSKGMGEIEYAEPNYIYYHQAVVSNDTYYLNNNLWGMYSGTSTPANDYGSHAAEAWASNHTGASTVYVGIIDEGYMYTHEDLAANAGVNPWEIAGNKKDDDLNGYIDDVYGWDFAGNNASVFDGVADDHGTHVAGTIGAVGGNGKGVAGVCWNVKLLNAKFLGATGGTLANAVKAVDYFTNLKNKGLNIVATNNSWGGGAFSQALQDAIGRANTAGILFIAAAGNDGLNTETTLSYPSGYPNDNIIAVAAIDKTGLLASFSNYAATMVDMGAPGVSIVSCVPVKSGKSIVSRYASYSGTSMATPHVTGAAALYASTHPGATAAQIKAAILGSVVPTSSLTGKCDTGGRLDVSGF